MKIRKVQTRHGLRHFLFVACEVHQNVCFEVKSLQRDVIFIRQVAEEIVAPTLRFVRIPLASQLTEFQQNDDRDRSLAGSEVRDLLWLVIIENSKVFFLQICKQAAVLIGHHRINIDDIRLHGDGCLWSGSLPRMLRLLLSRGRIGRSWLLRRRGFLRSLLLFGPGRQSARGYAQSCQKNSHKSRANPHLRIHIFPLPALMLPEPFVDGLLPFRKRRAPSARLHCDAMII